jgi:hypothetical protein
MIMKTTKKICKKAGHVMIVPFKWYIRTAAKNYENMFGENVKYVRFWM